MPESPRPWASWRMVWLVVYLLTLLVAARLYRYAPLGTEAGDAILDRWTAKVCYQTPPEFECYPLSNRVTP